MSPPHEKAVRSENDLEAGTECLWAVLYALQDLSDMTAEHSVDVNWETMGFLWLTSTTAVLMNLCDLRISKESHCEQATINRSLNEVYLFFHKTEVRMTLVFRVNFLTGAFVTMIWPYTLISSHFFQFYFLKRARQYHSLFLEGSLVS